MGRKLKKGKSGNAAQYLTRTQAVKKLQLRLSEFRRLCILKGIHPREPKKKVKGGNKTYYHVKDINWLAHEPLIATLRARKAHDKKVRKARAKQNLRLARRLLRAAPALRLDHLVRERYPSFVDALRDLDDALTLVHLFASLPAEGKYGIPSDAVGRCRRLALEWQAYCARTGALRKAFISVKGFYYQAEVYGQPVTWLVPHGLAQVLPPDVDYRVMLTFLDFYTTLLRFVMFKLYHGLGLRYPPVMDAALQAQAAELAAIMADIAGLQTDRQALQAEEQRRRDEAGAAQQQGAAGAKAVERAGAADEAAPDIVKRLAGLGAKVERLQGGGKGGKAVGDEDSDEEGEEGDFGIDSGDGSSGSGEEEQDEESGSGSEGADVGDRQLHDKGDRQQQNGGSGGATATAAPDGGGELAGVAGGTLGFSPDDDAALCGSLFKGCVMFLAREVPREPLLFIIRAFGGVAAWEGEGSPYSENDEAVTHQVVDRPVQGHRFLSRAYVQPQWVVDSANARVLVPAGLYAPGAAPPPHLSPFVDHEAEGYTPEFAQTVAKLQDAARRARERAAGLSVDAAEFAEGEEVAGGGGGDGEAQQQDGAALEKVYRRELAKELAGGAVEKLDGEEDEDEEEEGGSGSGEGEEEARRPARKGPAPAADGRDGEALAAMMMSRKKRKFYERIKRAQAGKEERVGVLEARKAALDRQEGKPPAARQTRGAGKRQQEGQQEQRVERIEPTMKKRRP